jgi:hypothetical protein
VVADRVEQILDQLHIAGVDGGAGSDPTLGISVDRQQLLGVDARDLPAAAQRRPQRRQHAGSQHTAAQLVEEVAPAVIDVIFADAHANLSDG